MNNDQVYFTTNNVSTNWFSYKPDSDLITNDNNYDDMKEFFDLVSNDVLLNDVDLKDIFNQDVSLFDESRSDDNPLFQMENHQNDMTYLIDTNYVSPKQENVISSMDGAHNYANQDAIGCFSQEAYRDPLSIGKNEVIDDKAEQQKNLMEQLLQRFQQDSSSAELILQLLELAKTTAGGNKVSKSDDVELPVVKREVNKVSPEVLNLNPSTPDVNVSLKDNKSKLIKIEKKQVSKKVQLLAKPVAQIKSQIILKNTSQSQQPPATPKFIVQQVSSSPLQNSQAQQYYITAANNCVVGSSAGTQIATKNLTVEELQQMLKIKNSQIGNENFVQQSPVSNVTPSNNAIITTLPFQVVERNDKVAISRLQTPQLYRVERKSTHNAIEKKYRMSINNRLEELKKLIDGQDSKLNKSSILKKAIEQIRYLRNSNYRLHEEVKYLKSLIGQKHIDFEVLTPPMETDFLVDYNQSSGDAQSYSSDDGFPSSPENITDDSLFLSRGIDPNMMTSFVGKSQYLLSFFLIIMFVMNPIGLLMGASNFAIPGLSSKADEGVSASYDHRTLKSIHEDISQSNPTSVWIHWITLWSLNIIFTLLVFARVTMFSEPVFKSNSKVATAFWRANAQAEVSIERGDYDDGERQLFFCLGVLGRTQAKSGFQLYMSLMWNILRQFLHRMHIGSWLESKAGDQVWRRCDSVCDVKQSASMAAHIYIKLLRMHTIKNSVTEGNRIYAMNLALSTVNMAEASGEVLPQTTLTESYVYLALTMKSLLPAFLHSYIQFTLHQTISELKLSPELSWLHTTEGLNFIFNNPFDVQDFKSFYTSRPQKQGNALTCMSRLHMEYLQEQTLSSMIMTFGLPIDQYKETMIELKDYIFQLQKYCQDLQLEKKGLDDENARWWCSALLMATYLPDQYQQLTCKKIDSPPKDLIEFPLAVCVHTILRVKEMLSSDVADVEAIKKMCVDASLLLKQSFTYKDDCYMRKCITESWQLLACDWLLNSLTEVVQKEEREEEHSGDVKRICIQPMHCSEDDLLVFEDLLSILRKLATHIKVAQMKLSLHETALRLIAGANPVKTLQMFERNVRQRNVGKEHLDASTRMSREEANSVLFWLRSLPKQMLDSHQSSDLLHSAVSAFEKLGDSKSAAKCRNVMLRMNV